VKILFGSSGIIAYYFVRIIKVSYLKVPPKILISDLVGKVKGKTAIQAFQKFPDLRIKKYWGNHF